ncbi:MAG: AarF/ABC1/UbiB kinase family protein [Campylobacterales bacterium]|nr:AarF/ABC1/UbiB kinase family protein [Campylobacterales bacterium]
MEVLRSIHDDLPPMGEEECRRVLGRAFVQWPFERFEETPIASASIGQVHEACLNDGTRVAVKLRREGIERRIRADIRIISAFNRLFRPLFSPLTRHSVESVVSEFSSMIVQECSMRRERQNLERFSVVYADAGIRFPTPYAAWCSDDALVMSFEEGFRFDDKEAIAAHNIDISPIIDRLVRFYTEQMLVKGFFHADPHPGNLLISPAGELILLDFGMVKRVSNPMRIAIIELIRAAHEKDYEAYVSAAKRMGTVAYDAPSSELAEFTERMFEIFGNDALDSGSMQQLAFEVMEQTRNLPFKLPQEAIYILRVSAIIEGLGTTYIENFNGIKDILPILQRNIPRALGVKESLWENIRDEVRRLPDDIAAARETLRKASRGELNVEISPMQIESIRHAFEASLRPLLTALTFALGSMGAWMADWKNAAFMLLAAAILRLWFR